MRPQFPSNEQEEEHQQVYVVLLPSDEVCQMAFLSVVVLDVDAVVVDHQPRVTEENTTAMVRMPTVTCPSEGMRGSTWAVILMAFASFDGEDIAFVRKITVAFQW